jgi:IclR family KDG regulon transcriptional repressor
MRALELLAFRPSSAAEVAHALQVHPRTARRLLNRLVADGYVTRTEGERRIYRPTMRLVALAGQVVERSELAQRAAPAVERLHRETGAAAHLSVPSYQSVLCLVHRAAPASDALRPQLRELVPAHSTAAGKVLLAHRTQWRASVLAQALERYTERTLVDAAELEREAARIRERGFAIEDGEYRLTQRGLAAPVFDATGEAVAALGIAGPADRLDGHALAAASPLVRRLAAAASEALGNLIRDS